MTEAGSSAIVLSSVSRRFGRQWAVRQASASFGAGAVHVIIGHNGAGKSTLLSLMAGALRPTDGSTLVLGADILQAEPSLRARVAWLPHKPFIYPDLTGHETLEFVARLYGRAVDKGAHEAVLERVGLAAAAHRKSRTYSRGMTQRLAIAAVLVQGADIWLMDEPNDRARHLRSGDALRRPSGRQVRGAMCGRGDPRPVIAGRGDRRAVPIGARAPHRGGGDMSGAFLRTVWLILRKDLLTELRSREGRVDDGPLLRAHGRGVRLRLLRG